MKPNENNDLERIVEKAMNASKTEKPSTNFTVDVMSQIEALEAKKISHTPIISHKRWLVITVAVSAIILSLYMLEFENESTYLDSLNMFETIDFSFLQSIPNLRIPNVFMYGILWFGVMFSIQIPLIKYFYLKKRIFNG